MNLYNNTTLFVVNHAYGSGGERVEVFELSDPTISQEKVVATWKRAVSFPTAPDQSLNDIVALSEDDFFVTQMFSHQVDHSRASDQWFQLSLLANVLFYEQSVIHHCEADQCLEVARGQGSNSIAHHDGKLYVTEVFNKRTVVYEKHPTTARYFKVSEFGTLHSADNISYDEETETFLVGSIGRMSDVEGNGESLLRTGALDPAVKGPGGAVEISHRAGVWIAKEIVMTDQISYVSSATRIGDFIVLGSWLDKAAAVCRI
jgi:hypothetical protein